MEVASRLSLLVSFFFLSHLLLPTEASIDQDFEALMASKSASDTQNKLASWNSGTHPCDWAFVSCLKNRVSRLVLENLDLHGPIEPLTSLTHLRVLSLKRNRFSGPFPSLFNFTSLNLLLSQNDFSGEFPDTVTSLLRLYRLDLSHNNFSGDIPTTVNKLTHLLSLRLNDNQFSGHIPILNLPKLQDLDISGNRFSGEIPISFSGFPGSVAPNIALPSMRRINPSPTANKKISQHHHYGASSKMSPVIITAIIVGGVLFLAIVSLLLCFWFR